MNINKRIILGFLLIIIGFICMGYSQNYLETNLIKTAILQIIGYPLLFMGAWYIVWRDVFK